MTTASFRDDVFLPEKYAYEVLGGPTFSSSVYVGPTGKEHRNRNWLRPRFKFDLGFRSRTLAEVRELNALLMLVRGSRDGFRLRDYSDYKIPAYDSFKSPIGEGESLGAPTRQLFRRYASGVSSTEYLYRKIKKLRSPVTVYKNGTANTSDWSTLDVNTGIVTFNLVQQRNIVNITPGASPTVFTVDTISGIGVVGLLLYVQGVNGSLGNLLNGRCLQISSWTNPNIVRLAINTTGYTYTGGGTLSRYPGYTDVYTWSGEYDVPVRFGLDKIDWQLQGYAKNGEPIFSSGSIPLLEDLRV